VHRAGAPAQAPALAASRRYPGVFTPFFSISIDLATRAWRVSSFLASVIHLAHQVDTPFIRNIPRWTNWQ